MCGEGQQLAFCDDGGWWWQWFAMAVSQAVSNGFGGRWHKKRCWHWQEPSKKVFRTMSWDVNPNSTDAAVFPEICIMRKHWDIYLFPCQWDGKCGKGMVGCGMKMREVRVEKCGRYRGNASPLTVAFLHFYWDGEFTVFLQDQKYYGGSGATGPPAVSFTFEKLL